MRVTDISMMDGVAMGGMASPALGVMDGMLRLYHAWDAVAEELVKVRAAPLCAQCGDCCRNNVPVAYGLEAVFALSYLIGQATLEEALQRAEAWLIDRHSQAPTRDALTLDKVTSGLEQKLQNEFMALAATPCPFLDGNTCFIHGCHPLVCRALGVTRTPPPKCKRPVGRGESLTYRTIVPEHASNMLREAVEAVLECVPKPTWAMAGFLPSLLIGLARPTRYHNLVESGSISTAKILVTSPSMGLLWQEQVETLVKDDITKGKLVTARS